ncbi:H-NS histone family protein [Glaciimonas sp. PCH181]|uniref:H-NS histone family protein n=1 Tax=Glaciimonas sp. PCH181 TaxID=2133943 RepID=UPI000D359191|nr:H-NS histone family protein [Glaciimonas sp. PCH181]PUA19082.1 hypothetical protein C7W93_04070 [Glaciimonas sp. PCH181]
MSTYRELQDQIEQLRKQAEEVRLVELADVILEIKTKMQEYGITGADLGLMGKKRVMKPSSTPVEAQEPQEAQQSTPENTEM